VVHSVSTNVVGAKWTSGTTLLHVVHTVTSSGRSNVVVLADLVITVGIAKRYAEVAIDIPTGGDINGVHAEVSIERIRAEVSII
jgi:hypothetical protein